MFSYTTVFLFCGQALCFLFFSHVFHFFRDALISVYQPLDLVIFPSIFLRMLTNPRSRKPHVLFYKIVEHSEVCSADVV